MEGRDIGTAVAPEAPLKVWLTASLDERARRRALEMGDAADLGRVEGEIAGRDEADTTRAESPLIKPPDALEIDSTGMPIDAVVERIVELVSLKLDR